MNTSVTSSQDTRVMACPLDITTKAAAIGGNLAHVGEHVALHWNSELKRLFVGLDLTAGAGEHDGACAFTGVHIYSPSTEPALGTAAESPEPS